MLQTLPTLSSRLRSAHPLRYVRKDARRDIYAALFGPVDRSKKPQHDNSGPEHNEFRIRLSNDWQNIKGFVLSRWKEAAFSPRRSHELVSYFNRHAHTDIRIEASDLYEALS